MFVVTPEGVIATDPIAYGRPSGGADYVAGGQALKDAGATIIAHQRTKQRMEKAPLPATPLPDETGDDSGRVIRLGGKVLELSYVGQFPGLGWGRGGV